MRLSTCIMGMLCIPALASAQPAVPSDDAGGASAPVTESPAPPPSPAPVPAPSAMSALPPNATACERERALIVDTAAANSDVEARRQLLAKLRDCSQPIATMAEPQPVVVHEHRGLVGEIAGGFGTMSTESSGYGSSNDQSGLSLAAGAGLFASPQIELGGRLAGVMYSAGDNTGYNGFLGPYLRFWATPQFAVGGGVGLGLSTATCESCETFTSLGWDARVSYAFAPDGHGAQLGLEITHNSIDLSEYMIEDQIDILSISLQLGYAAF